MGLLHATDWRYRSDRDPRGEGCACTVCRGCRHGKTKPV